MVEFAVLVWYNEVYKNVPAVLVTPRDTSKPDRRFAVSDHTTQTPLKRCHKCGEFKPATTEYFSKGKHYTGGLRSQCKVCRNAAHAAWHTAHPDKAKAYNATYRSTNRDKVKASRDAYAGANPDKVKASRDAYVAANRDRVKASKDAWRAANPDKVRVRTQRRRAAKRSLPATFTATDWKRCLEYWGYCCAYCGRPKGLWHTLSQDHFVPICRGGAYEVDNILPACCGEGGCNNSKGKRDVHEWLAGKFGARKAARIERRINEYFDHVAIHQEVNHE